MIFDILQTASGFSASYEIRRGTERIGSAQLDNNLTNGGTLRFAFLGEWFTLTYAPTEQIESWFKNRQDKTNVPYLIHRDGSSVGRLFQRFSGESVLKRFEYSAMELDGREYAMYEVGLGKEGMRYPIYEGERQIALIEKETVVHDNLDVFHAMALDGRAGLAAALFTLYKDMRSFANRGQVRRTSRQESYTLTTNKTLKSKFDPGFRNRITE